MNMIGDKTRFSDAVALFMTPELIPELIPER